MEIRASAEDYLETILLLTKKIGTVRSIDIVDDMGFSKPSVSVAMKKLRENELITMDEDGRITLTENGRQAAEQVYERHTLLCDWLVSIGVDEKTATVDACRLEHILSREAFSAIKRQHEGRGKKAKKL